MYHRVIRSIESGIVCLFATILFVACTEAPTVSPVPNPKPITAISNLPDFADIVEESHPAVVNIYTRSTTTSAGFNTPSVRNPNKHPLLPDERVQQSLGSGFLVDPDGLVITNYHVIDGASQISVRLLDNRLFDAEIVGIDPSTDLALVQLQDASKLPVLTLGDSSTLRAGQWVIAIGNPLGLNNTVTAGVVSAIGRRSLPMNSQLQYQDFIQTDASINPGNSGGPLLNHLGDVVGINTAISLDGHGIGFAIPSNMIKAILPRLKQDGHVQRSWLGLYVNEISVALREQLELRHIGGALVLRVVDDSPAHKAAIKPGDIILNLDGRPIESAAQLTWIAGHLPLDEPIKIGVQRNNDMLSLTLQPEASPQQQ